MKNVELKVRIRNGALVKAVEEDKQRLGFTLRQWCKMAGISPGTYQELVTFKIPLTNKRDGQIKDIVMKICNALCMDFKDLFDQELYEEIETNAMVTYVSPDQLRQLCDTKFKQLPKTVPDVSLKRQVEELLETLSPREEKVLRMRFGIGEEEHTLTEVGASFGVGRERLRQIEKKAVKKLRHPSRSTLLREYYEA